MLAILLLLVIGFLVYRLVIKPMSYWSDRNVKTGRVIPIFGDFFYATLAMESFMDMARRIYNSVPDVRYLGAFQFTQPLLVLRSSELIKQVCVKDFDHFLDRPDVFPEGADILLTGNLFFLRGKKWKDMRSTLSPSFTSSKIKTMYVLICKNAKTFTQYFLDKKEDLIEIELKDACTRYAMDIIANSAFGLQVDSLKDKQNEFYMMGKDASNFASNWKKFAILVYQMMPSFAAFIRLSIFGGKVKSFFVDIVTDTLRMREKQNIHRPDMLGLLMEARKGKVHEKPEEEIKEASFAVVEEHLELKKCKTELTDIEITCQAFIFFLAGFETVSSAMCLLIYELAVNPDVQKRLIEEIDEHKTKGTLSYETFVNMTYLDMVVTEGLRRRPPVPAVERTVTKPYTIQPERPDEKPLHLEKNDRIFIPVFGIHHDPKYYENPEKFDPERFSPENRKNIDPYTYLPFGVGPRNCIGSRFALVEIKALLVHLLSHFEVVPVERTPIPFQYDKMGFGIVPKDGLRVGLKRRNL